MKSLCQFFAFAAAATCALAAGQPAEAARHPLVWDAMEKTVEARTGEAAADFVFKATNTSDRPVTILSVQPSCGCTVVDLPASPWVLAPGASGSLTATVEFNGKDGSLTKSLFVDSTAGAQTLVMQIKLPPMDATARLRNQEIARADRQAVFRGSCVECHSVPAFRRTGEELFRAACLNCHTQTGRASMVPDLLVARERRNAEWWRKWITEGRTGTLMPAFAEKNGGPLTEAQIDSLVEFALSHLPTESRTN
jgi:mono/diheme cytochrome c family protein